MNKLLIAVLLSVLIPYQQGGLFRQYRLHPCESIEWS